MSQKKDNSADVNNYESGQPVHFQSLIKSAFAL